VPLLSYRVLRATLFQDYNPLVFGDYPKILKENAGEFIEIEAEQVKGSFDFIGLNHYISAYVKDNSYGPKAGLRDFTADMSAAIAGSFLFLYGQQVHTGKNNSLRL